LIILDNQVKNKSFLPSKPENNIPQKIEISKQLIDEIVILADISKQITQSSDCEELVLPKISYNKKN